MISEEREKRLALLEKVISKQAELQTQLAEQEIQAWKEKEVTYNSEEFKPKFSPFLDSLPEPSSLEIQEDRLIDIFESPQNQVSEQEISPIDSLIIESEESRDEQVEMQKQLEEKDYEIAKLRQLIRQLEHEKKKQNSSKKAVESLSSLEELEEKKKGLLEEIKILKGNKLDIKGNLSIYYDERIKALEKSVTKWRSRAIDLATKHCSALKTLKRELKILKMDTLKLKSHHKEVFVGAKKDLSHQYTEFTSRLSQVSQNLGLKKKRPKSKTLNK